MAARNPETVAKVGELRARDRQMTLKSMEDEPQINREAIRQIIYERFLKTKLCMKFVPQSHLRGHCHDCELPRANGGVVEFRHRPRSLAPASVFLSHKMGTAL